MKISAVYVQPFWS